MEYISMFLEKKMKRKDTSVTMLAVLSNRDYLNKKVVGAEYVLERVKLVKVITELLVKQRFCPKDSALHRFGDRKIPKISSVMKLLRTSYDLLRDSEIELMLISFGFDLQEVHSEILRHPRGNNKWHHSDIVLDSPFGPGLLYESSSVASRMGRGPVAWYRTDFELWNPGNLSLDEMIASTGRDKQIVWTEEKTFF